MSSRSSAIPAGTPTPKVDSSDPHYFCYTNPPPNLVSQPLEFFKSSPQNPFEYRLQTLHMLHQALHRASVRIAQAAAGQSVFTNDLDARTTLAMLRYLKPLLEHLPSKPPPPPTPPDPYDKAPGLYTPICPNCLEGPAAHRVANCPTHPKDITPHELQRLINLQIEGRVRPR